METIRCPYCECKVLMSDVEDDDGACPECGAPLLGSQFMDDFVDEPGDAADTELDADADLPVGLQTHDLEPDEDLDDEDDDFLER
jgi:hypothetical protein